ncbi:MAG: CPBP family intramembrane metalloprotease [Puniceicoccales bacterium]|jgi:membrane protease YdiL (CAAX protease family)|nr:CPBP family intramembrane metalloprotease [Puniceicoccales bacterium]
MDRRQSIAFLILAPQLFAGICLLLRWRPAISPSSQEPRWRGTGWDAIAFFSLTLAIFVALPDLIESLLPGNGPISGPFQFLGTCAYALFLPLVLCRGAFSFSAGLSPTRHPVGLAFLRGGLHYLRAIPFLFLADIFGQYFLNILCSIGLPLSMEPQNSIRELENASPFSLIFLIPILCAAAPFGEEILFRGGIYRWLKLLWGKRLATFLTAGIFAGLHGNWIAFFPLFALSLLLVRTYEIEGNLLPCICLHGLFNFNGILLTFLGR